MTAINPQAKTVLDLMAASGQPTLDQLSPADARIGISMGVSALQAPKAEVAEVRDLSAQGPAGPIKLRLYRPLGSATGTLLPGLVYFHGGGWTIGDLDLYDALCRLLANAGHCVVVSVDYRLGPEARFPAAVDDAFAATQYVAENAGSLGINAAKIAVGGDSAGGNLATVVALLARDGGGPGIAFQLLLYPVTDLHGDSASYRESGQGYFLTESLMKWFAGNYIRNESDKDDWRASPLLAPSLAGLPPAHVVVCGFDPLRDEGMAYADRLSAAGVPVTFENIEDQIHGFLLMEGAIPGAITAINDIGTVLRSALA